MRKATFVMAAFVAAILCTAPAFSRQQPDASKDKSKEDAMKDCPMHEQHTAASKAPAAAHSHQSASGSDLEGRGNAAMGFAQTKTTHHFLLKAGGGSIQVQANDPQDAASVSEIRKHLQRITEAFAAGDFQIPMMVHDTIAPGTTTMKRLRGKIQYIYEETPTGARVVIKTADPSAIDAVHDFLRFQIREHETGDPETTGQAR